MKSLPDALKEIEAAPDRLLQFVSLEKLSGFLMGWASAEFGCWSVHAYLSPFRNWLAESYGFSDVYGVFLMLQFIGKNDRDAFDLFFKKLREYEGVHPGFISSIVIKPEGKRISRLETYQRLKSHPGAWIGSASLPAVTGFLDGDACVRLGADRNSVLSADLRIVQKRFNRKLGCNILLPLETILLVNCGYDHSAALVRLHSEIEGIDGV